MNNPSKATSKIVMAILVFMLFSLCLVYTVSAQSTVVNAEASISQLHVGDTLTVYIKISNVQNLFGVDVTLDWNPSVLKLVSPTPQLGVESHPSGVLHESSTYPIEVVNNNASQSDGEYHLLATSTGSTTAAFSGTGTIATLTFTVTSTGPIGLELSSELSDKAATGGTANLIDHTDTVDSVNAVIPEFPTITVTIVLVLLATASIVLSAKLLKNRANLSIKKATNF